MLSHRHAVLQPGNKDRHQNTAMENLCSPLQLSGLQAAPDGGHQGGTHVPSKPALFLLLLGSGNAYQLWAPPAPKTQGKAAGNAKHTTNTQDAFTRAYSLLPSDFDAVKSDLRQVLDLK